MSSMLVRLKRKRCEEPTESLLVACKRGKPSDEGQTTADDNGKGTNNSSSCVVQKEIFKLAGTVNSKVSSPFDQ